MLLGEALAERASKKKPQHRAHVTENGGPRTTVC